MTCSLSSRDPITTLNSLPVTLLIHSYLHMKPRECEANCSSPPLTRSFLSIQSVTSPFILPVCSLCGWHSVPLLDCQSCSGKLSNYNLNVPAESLLIPSWDRERDRGKVGPKKEEVRWRDGWPEGLNVSHFNKPCVIHMSRDSTSLPLLASLCKPSLAACLWA